MKKVFFTGHGLNRVPGTIMPSTNDGACRPNEELFFPDEGYHNLVRKVTSAEPLEGLFINLPGTLIEEE
jgi:hypothetical protein